MSAGAARPETVPDPLRVFVNGVPVELPRGATALDAVRAADPAAAAAVAAGERVITDSRGLPEDPAAAAFAGAIYRVVRGGRRGGAADGAEARDEERPLDDRADDSSLLH